MNAASPSLTTPHRAWLRIEDFLLLDGNGAFADSAKTELIDGEILCMNAQFQRHSYVKSQLAFRLMTALAASAPDLLVIVEVAVAMPPHDMPEPDIVILRGPPGNGAVALAAVKLLVEVSDTTLEIDLGRKAALYARHGVPEYWVADVTGGRIIRHWRPGADGYTICETTDFGTAIAAATMDGVVIETSGLN